ncbi:unnamed protein product, partial [Effrenium voratum]
MAAPCCPAGSHGAAPPDDVDLQGSWEKHADLDCYMVGEKEKPSSVIFAFSDVFGVLSGRHRRICDDIAASVPGSLVCLPDLFHGDPIAPDFSDSRFPRMRQKLFMPKMVYRIRYRFGWAQVGPDIQGLVDSLKEQHAVPFMAFGFCYGGYVMAKACTTGFFSAGVGFHPSPIVATLQCQPHNQKMPDLAKEVKCPLLMVPADNDDAT